jgi:hypothetical protein
VRLEPVGNTDRFCILLAGACVHFSLRFERDTVAVGRKHGRALGRFIAEPSLYRRLFGHVQIIHQPVIETDIRQHRPFSRAEKGIELCRAGDIAGHTGEKKEKRG